MEQRPEGNNDLVESPHCACISAQKCLLLVSQISECHPTPSTQLAARFRLLLLINIMGLPETFASLWRCQGQRQHQVLKSTVMYYTYIVNTGRITSFTNWPLALILLHRKRASSQGALYSCNIQNTIKAPNQWLIRVSATRKIHPIISRAIMRMHSWRSNEDAAHSALHVFSS